MTALKTFAANLVRLRGTRKVIHTANAAGISPRTLNYYEQGRWVPTQYVLQSLLAAVDAPPSEVNAIHALRNAAENEHCAALSARGGR